MALSVSQIFAFLPIVEVLTKLVAELPAATSDAEKMAAITAALSDAIPVVEKALGRDFVDDAAAIAAINAVGAVVLAAINAYPAVAAAVASTKARA